MRQATDKEIKDFVNYRANHVALVQRIGKVVFNMDFSNHDADKIEADGEMLNLWALRNSMNNGNYNPRKSTKKVFSKMVGEHVCSQPHHPEHYCKGITPNNFDDSNPPVCKPSRMPKAKLIEMACDWASVALYDNEPIFQWYNSKCTGNDPRYIFTAKQKDTIITALLKIQDSIKKEKLMFPGRKYTAKKSYPVIDFKIKENLSERTDYTIKGIKLLSQKEYEEILSSFDSFQKHIIEYKDSYKNYFNSTKETDISEFIDLISQDIDPDAPVGEYTGLWYDMSDMIDDFNKGYFSNINSFIYDTTLYRGIVKNSSDEGTGSLGVCWTEDPNLSDPIWSLIEHYISIGYGNTLYILKAINPPRNTNPIVNVLLSILNSENEVRIIDEDALKKVKIIKHIKLTESRILEEMEGISASNGINASSTVSAFAPENTIKVTDPSGDILKESNSKTAAVCFGRYQPATKGHLHMWRILEGVDADAHLIYTSHKQDKKDNPLDYGTKSKYIKQAIEDNHLNVEFVDSDARTFIDVLVDVAHKGYDGIIIVAGEDRLEKLTGIIKDYNGVPNKNGDFIKFNYIDGVSSGKRDPDSDGTEGISASKLRAFVKENDFESFLKGSPVKDESIVKEMFEAIKSNTTVNRKSR